MQQQSVFPSLFGQRVRRSLVITFLALYLALASRGIPTSTVSFRLAFGTPTLDAASRHAPKLALGMPTLDAGSKDDSNHLKGASDCARADYCGNGV